MSEFVLVYTTVPKLRKARQLAKTLVRERLIACANIFKIDSVYRWEGEIEEAREYGMILKTRAELYSQLEAKIEELHPYDVPAIIALPIETGSRQFLDWIDRETSPVETARRPPLKSMSETHRR